jgi:hypothetical protein
VPVRRLLSLTIGGFSLLLGFGLIMGVQTSGPTQRLPFAIVVFGAQVLYVFASAMAMRPPGGKVVAGAGVLTALVASYLVNDAPTATIVPLGVVAAAGFGVGVIGQLVTRQGRMRLSETIGATAVVVVGVVSFAMLLVLVRVPLGTQTISIVLAACGVALGVARLTDVALPYPRMAAQVPRGAAGVILGTMVGTVVASYIGRYMLFYTPKTAALVGALAAAVAIAADLTLNFAEAGRELEGDPPTMWLARHMQGPLAGFALAAPTAYLLNVFLWTGS